MSTIDTCLNEIDRLRAKRVAAESHLWAAEFLLHRVAKLLPHLIADSAHNAVARDTLAEEIRELLEEDRNHPGASVLLDAPKASDAALVGDIGQDGTTLADEVALGLHDEPSP